MKNAKKILWPIVAALCAGVIFVSPAKALRVNFQALGDSDKVTFSFDSNALPKAVVSRTGATGLLISLPPGIWDTEPKPTNKTYPGKLVQSITSSEKGVVLETRTNAFGYIRLPVPGSSDFVVQVFRDPIGARWTPEKTTPKPASTFSSQSKVQPKSLPIPAVQTEPVAVPQDAVEPPAVIPDVEKKTTSTSESDRKPFFAVPYSVRSEVAPPPTGRGSKKMPVAASTSDIEKEKSVIPVDQPESVKPDVPREVVTGIYPASNALRFKAVKKTADDVQFAELARPVVESSAAVSGKGQVSGQVMASPPTVVNGAPPPAATPEETAQVVESLEAARKDAVASPDVSSVVSDQAQADGAAADGEQVAQSGTGEEPVPELSPEEQAKAHQEEIRDALYDAQSLMFNGALEAALPLYEDILKQADVPDDVREETLFAVADIKKQLYSGTLVDRFDEVGQAYIAAMNANLRSTRVPRALLNLGLLNLQVGNFPEARAYFKILQEKYPDDDNIPSISYYWGEFFYRKKEYKKAADQFQYLIQTYPEHQLVKPAAFYLADSLNRTGFLEQGFQIVDYIDKRWPNYYMENPEFLRLAGDVEMELKKWQAAKNHYFTAYNLNPDADGADVVLARIGDIYIRLGEKQSAKQIYEKVVTNYPDAEGGLIGKMRLAEEGIYDDPAMHEMVDVFDRPYNLNPQRVYKDIVTQHPDSPLAPIAQLKLAMWYAFNKKYPEALTAAQDLVENYPDNPLVAKARKLGDSVFVLAVPGMIDEERFGRVVRYWETYDFIGKDGSKVNDTTKIAIATSYWKIGQPDKALALIAPYLQKKQIPGASGEALGLAVNIHLDQLNWKDIADLVAMAKKNWTLDPAQQKQLEYARAMSLQNLGDARQAMPLWAELAKDASVSPAFRAYAMYYMAKDAMQRQDLRRVFVYAQEALALLLQTHGDPEKIKDTVLMSIYATERSGRYDEALKWAKEYDRYIKVDNPEWASTRFKLARIYRKAGAMEEWRHLLGDIIEKKPETLQAQLAKSALQTYELEQKASVYQGVQ
ncbi:tetratricopeptide repeat protein [Pseudodesulfovibrio sp. JC047]|uniref:tetratricopeptide repeat protein n=1 Tax=Pseudodesulfovibrio sp. JC047 TaxID=2683199 RepID=UPI0013D4A5BF|nr:tetratricopeptide repeat protein [Pseudodesulfovibrio sp. JC047]